MRISKKASISNVFYSLGSLLCFFLALACIFIRFKRSSPFSKEEISIFAVRPFLPQGYVSLNSLNTLNFRTASTPRSALEPTKNASNSEYSGVEIPKPPPAINPQDEDKHSPGEKTYKIVESQFSSSGLKYENFYVKNIAGKEINIAKELKTRPDVHIKKSDEPQVLIYHTHTSESYLKKDEGFFYESYYPRSTDNMRNVTQVGEAITKKLVEHGIPTIHDQTYHDSPTYNGSYSRSKRTILSNLEKYPSIQVTIDVHRDSMGDLEHGKIKPTFKINGTKAAQIMIVAGCDKDASNGFPDWEYNLRLALRLQKCCETMFPGLTRPLSFGNFKYNMNLSHGGMLIEVGSDVNTLTEAVYSGTLVGEALASVLNELRD